MKTKKQIIERIKEIDEENNAIIDCVKISDPDCEAQRKIVRNNKQELQGLYWVLSE